MHTTNEENTLAHPNEPTVLSTSYGTRTLIHIYKKTQKKNDYFDEGENSENATKKQSL